MTKALGIARVKKERSGTCNNASYTSLTRDMKNFSLGGGS